MKDPSKHRVYKYTERQVESNAGWWLIEAKDVFTLIRLNCNHDIFREKEFCRNQNLFDGVMKCFKELHDE